MNQRIYVAFKLWITTLPRLLWCLLRIKNRVSRVFYTQDISSVPRRLDFSLNPKSKRILVVDKDLPAADRNAGAVSLLQFLTVFQQQGFDVFFWPQNQAPSSYLTLLEKEGICVLSPYSTTPVNSEFGRWWRENRFYFDKVLLSRPSVAAAFIPVLTKYPLEKPKIAYYGHDLHFSRLSEEAKVKGHKEIAWLAKRFYRLERKIWRQVDVSYYPSPNEVSAVKQIDAQVRVEFMLPYFINEIHNETTPIPIKQQLLFVGNFSHTPNIDGIAWFLSQVWPMMTTNNPKAELLIVGAKLPPHLQTVCEKSHHVRYAGWVSQDDLQKHYQESRVIVVPLRFGAGVKHKVVDALAQHRPIVTTPTGLQGLDWLKEYIPTTEDAPTFAARCLDLLEKDDLWKNQTERTSRAIKTYFSPDQMANMFSFFLVSH
jgi:glycosyltransferase involved in cell wall biosynthesis